MARAAPRETLDKNFRRVLQVIDGETHIDVIRGWLRHYTNAQLSDWLGKLETSGLLVAQPSSSVHDLDFTDSFPAVPRYGTALTSTDVVRIDAGTVAAGAALKAHGAYLAEERLNNRAPLAKSPAEITVLILSRTIRIRLRLQNNALVSRVTRYAWPTAVALFSTRCAITVCRTPCFSTLSCRMEMGSTFWSMCAAILVFRSFP